MDWPLWMIADMHSIDDWHIIDSSGAKDDNRRVGLTGSAIDADESKILEAG